MKNLLLSVALIAVPVGVFAAVESILPHAPADTAQSQPAPTLGDLARYQTIVADVQKISASGNLTAAGKRVTDFEALWDKEASDLRAKDRAAWNRSTPPRTRPLPPCVPSLRMRPRSTRPSPRFPLRWSIPARRKQPVRSR